METVQFWLIVQKLSFSLPIDSNTCLNWERVWKWPWMIRYLWKVRYFWNWVTYRLRFEKFNVKGKTELSCLLKIFLLMLKDYGISFVLCIFWAMRHQFQFFKYYLYCVKMVLRFQRNYKNWLITLHRNNYLSGRVIKATNL